MKPILRSIAPILTTLLVASLAILLYHNLPQGNEFDGAKAYNHVEYQVNLGPRTLGSDAHQKTQMYILDELKRYGWVTEEQSVWVNELILVTNIVGKRESTGPWIILGAHYDTRLSADHDPDPANRKTPVPGANDGASGVGVLLELARVIPKDIQKKIWLVFFDAEDNGNLPGYDWIMGSRMFAETLTTVPDSVVILDMVGDKDLNIYIEKNSDPELTREIWQVAHEAGHLEFIPIAKYRILDDHIPFVNLDIPAVDIIDFDYPHWHTINDTLDKVSAESLESVGDTLLKWIQK